MKSKLKISCQEASYLISKQQETPISFYQKLQLKMHLYVCTACKLFNKQSAFLLKLIHLNQSTSTPSLPSDAKKKMQQKLNEEMQ